MKFVLIDYTNYGVVFLHESQNVSKLKWDFNILKNCILDTHVVGTQNNYNYLNNQFILNNFVYENRNTFSVGDKHELNETFAIKQDKAALIFPIISKLTHALITQSFKHIPEFYFQIDDTLAYQLNKCIPENNEYSSGVIRYAQVVGMSNEEAYKELTLEVDTIHALKMRAYATTKKYENLIREVSTKERADELIEEIEQKLIRECHI
jgi:hypothetical protein